MSFNTIQWKTIQDYLDINCDILDTIREYFPKGSFEKHIEKMVDYIMCYEGDLNKIDLSELVNTIKSF